MPSRCLPIPPFKAEYSPELVARGLGDLTSGHLVTFGAGRIIERPERDPRPSGSRVSRHGFPWPDVVSRARLTVSYRSAHGWLMLRAHAQHR